MSQIGELIEVIHVTLNEAAQPVERSRAETQRPETPPRRPTQDAGATLFGEERDAADYVRTNFL
jgi:hypothetical protein